LRMTGALGSSDLKTRRCFLMMVSAGFYGILRTLVHAATIVRSGKDGRKPICRGNRPPDGACCVRVGEVGWRGVWVDSGFCGSVTVFVSSMAMFTSIILMIKGPEGLLSRSVRQPSRGTRNGSYPIKGLSVSFVFFFFSLQCFSTVAVVGVKRKNLGCTAGLSGVLYRLGYLRSTSVQAFCYRR